MVATAGWLATGGGGGGDVPLCSSLGTNSNHFIINPSTVTDDGALLDVNNTGDGAGRATGGGRKATASLTRGLDWPANGYR